MKRFKKDGHMSFQYEKLLNALPVVYHARMSSVVFVLIWVGALCTVGTSED